MGRATQGVKLIDLRANDEIAAVTKVKAIEVEDDEEIVDSGDIALSETTESIDI
jgi:DNA gyrase subunit A